MSHCGGSDGVAAKPLQSRARPGLPADPLRVPSDRGVTAAVALSFVMHSPNLCTAHPTIQVHAGRTDNWPEHNAA